MNNYVKLPNKLTFDCGCTFPIVNDNVKVCFDLHNPKHTINFECPETYRLLSEGLTQGVFQLNSPLGTQWTRKVQPTELEHISALGAILRPSCLESKDKNNNSITVRYERKKNGKMEIQSYHPIVDNILKDTYGENIYQETAIELAKQCAGFSLQEADALRKAAGKKLPEEMAKMKTLFLQKGKQLDIFSDEQLQEIFSWIEASQRYSFNRSHSMSYGIIGYITAYIKAHFPLQFYKEWLRNTDKREDYVGLVNEAKLFNINVYPPDIRERGSDFYTKNKNVHFGLENIKGIISKDFNVIHNILTTLQWKREDLGKTITWLQFLSEVSENISSRTMDGLIGSGALSCFHMDRALLAYEYERWTRLSPGEKKHASKYATLLDLVNGLIAGKTDKYTQKQLKYAEDTERRKNSTRTYKAELKKPKANSRLEKLAEIQQELARPVYSVVDTVDSLLFAEEHYLGVALSRHKTDEIQNCSETATCLEVAKGRKGYVVLKVKIERASSYKCKNGQSAGRNMCFLTISDKTSTISAVAFPDTYEQHQHMLTTGNIVFVSGELNKQDSFQVVRVYAIS